MDLAFISNYSQIWIALIVFILAFAGMKKLKFYDNNFALAIISLLVAIIFASYKPAVNYIFNIIPLLTVIMTVSFVLLLVLVFIAKDIGAFKKPLAVIGFVLAILIVLCVAFNSFPMLNHMLPHNSNSGLSHEAIHFKNWIYSTDFKEGLIFVICVSVVGFFLLKK